VRDRGGDGAVWLEKRGWSLAATDAVLEAFRDRARDWRVVLALPPTATGLRPLSLRSGTSTAPASVTAVSGDVQSLHT